MDVLNINVGILGHVDSGKTSLVKALSTILSTASLDKNPQSRERGITLDLGFSAFTVAVPDHLNKDKYGRLQFTLVDCPGHASLIRTIIGGAQILDVMIVVVDVTKGMQAQTVECVVIGEAVMGNCDGGDVIVVLNKVDLIPESERERKVDKAKKDIAAHLATTKLSNASIVSCAAVAGGERIAASRSNSARHTKVVAKKGGQDGRDSRTHGKSGALAGVGNEGQPTNDESATIGITAVVAELTRRTRVPDRRDQAPFYFAFDHCFSVRGVGTIVTGTVLAGEVKVNQFVELPALRLQKKVKSMQVFRKPVNIARAGDRVGLCLASLDAKLLERGVVAAPSSVRPLSAALALVRKVPAFRGRCQSGAYCHVSLGHTTVMATATFFGAKELKKGWRAFIGAETEHMTTGDCGWEEEAWSLDDMANLPFPWKAEFAQQPCLLGRVDPIGSAHISVVLGSRLDATVLDANAGNATNSAANGRADLGGVGEGYCRIAFHGRLVRGAVDDGNIKTRGDLGSGLGLGTEAGQLKLFNEKVKTGVVFRIGDASGAGERSRGHDAGVEVFAKDLFKRETKMTPFIGMLLHTEGGVVGRIESAFGKAGRFRARFPRGTSVKVGDKLLLKFRKYVRDPCKIMDQSYLRKELHSGERQHENRNEGAQPRGTGTLPPSTMSTAPTAGDDNEETRLREGHIDTLKNTGRGDAAAFVAITSGLFSQEEDIRALATQGMSVFTRAGVKGTLRGPFGKAGKCKVEFAHGARVQVGDLVFVPR